MQLLKKFFLIVPLLLIGNAVASADLALSFNPVYQQNGPGSSLSYDILATSDVLGGETIIFGSAPLTLTGDPDIVFAATLTQSFNAGLNAVAVTTNTIIASFNVAIQPTATFGDAARIDGTFSAFTTDGIQLGIPFANFARVGVAVPEPTSLALAGLVGLGCIFGRRKRS